MKEPKFILMLAQSLIGTGFFFIYIQHVRSIFESRTKIAYMNHLERESLIRREDALFYSFYKTIAEEPDFWKGYEKLKNVTSIEYPTHVNVLQRFEVLPELVIGYVYHWFKRITPGHYLPLTICWHSNSSNVPNGYEKHCDMSAQPMQLYLELVWVLGGFTVLILYMYGSLLSETVFGGIYAVVSYLMFHKHTSKIYDRPVARENFASPFIFLHIFYTCMCIERLVSTKKLQSRCFFIIKLGILTSISLLCWKFSGVIFAVQVLIMMLPWKAKSVSSTLINLFCFDFAASQLLGMLLAYYFSHWNNQYIFGWQLGPSLSLAFTSAVRFFYPHKNYNTWEAVFAKYLFSTSFQVAIFDFFEKINFLKPNDKTFLQYRDIVVHWLLEIKVNFITRLAACNPSYDRIPFEEIFGLVETLLIKPYCVYGVVMLAIFFRNTRKKKDLQQNQNSEHIERAKNYVLEDFLEENKVSMKDMSNEETKKALDECLSQLEKVNYNYEAYKAEKELQKKSCKNELSKFMDELKVLKAEINEANERIQNEEENKKEQVSQPVSSENESSEKPSKKLTSTSTTNKNPKPLKNNKAKPKSDWNFKNISMQLFRFHYIYSSLQMGFFTLLGLNIRKLFFLCFAEGCVLAPALCSKLLSFKHRKLYWGISLAISLLSLFTPGMENMRQEYYPSTKVTPSDDLESLLDWINLNTEKDAVFAGPIEIIGTVHMATKRNIANHAHLEMPQISDRTEHVYSMYSRQQSTDIYNQFAQMKIQYVIVSIDQCKEKPSNPCNLLTIWDSLQPNYWKFPQFCSELISKNIPSFLKVYSNDYYAVIKMFSQSVQLNLKYNRMPEKCI